MSETTNLYFKWIMNCKYQVVNFKIKHKKIGKETKPLCQVGWLKAKMYSGFNMFNMASTSFLTNSGYYQGFLGNNDV